MYVQFVRSSGIWAIITFLLIASTAIAQSLSPNNQTTREPAQQNSASSKKPENKDHSGSANVPIATKSLTSDPNPSQAQVFKTDHEDKASNELRLTISTEWLAIFTFGLVIVGLIQVGLFAWQLSLMRSSLIDTNNAARAANKSAEAAEQTVKIMQDTAQRQMRAYISVNGITDWTVDEGYIGFRLTIRNTGQTPAYNLRSGSKVSIAPFPRMDPLPHVPLTEKSLATLGPATEQYLIPYGHALSTSELAGFEKTEVAIYIHGRIEYHDAFGQLRVTSFTKVKRKSLNGNLVIGIDKDGNDAT